MSNFDKIRKITKQLYPTGLAWKFRYTDAAIGSFGDAFNASFDTSISAKNPNRRGQLHTALAKSEEQAFNDALNLIDCFFPDNDNFTTQDATEWERRIGIISSPSSSLDDRKKAIIQKLNHPNNIQARQSRGFLEQQFRLAGFNVRVYDNLEGKNIYQVLTQGQPNAQMEQAQMGQVQMGFDLLAQYNSMFTSVQMGQTQMGQTQMGVKIYNNKVVNNIDESKYLYLYPISWRTVFYIGGENLGEFASIPAPRKNEFRQLVLQLKPINTFAYLLINFI
jgi:hypothetical protein